MRQGKVTTGRAAFETLKPLLAVGLPKLFIEKLKCQEKDEKKEKGG